MAQNQKIEMPRVKLGSQGLQVSRLGFGCMGLSGTYNAPVPEEDGIQLIKECFNRGVTFFDTANNYGVDHANEILVGKVLKHFSRDKVQVATKFGVVNVDETKVTVNGTPEYVRSCCESSLKHLDVDYIDLYYVHRTDTTVPIEDTMGELKKLVEEGKIKYIGLSEASLDTIRRAHAVHPITAVQMEYSLWTRDIEEDIIPTCRELGIGIVSYSPIGGGFFAGRAVKGWSPRLTGDNFDKNMSMFNRVDALAKNHGCTPAQLALSWVLNQGLDIVPIPGTTKIKNLESNIGSLRVELSADDIKEIADAVPIDQVSAIRPDDKFARVSWRFTSTPTKHSN